MDATSRTNAEIKIENELFLKAHVHLLVFTGKFQDDLELRAAVNYLRKNGITITKPRLALLCEDLYNNQLHALSENELHLLFRAVIYKIRDMLMTRKGLTPGEFSNLSSKLGYLIQLYREQCPEKNEDDPNNNLLNAILTRLYSTPEGLALIAEVEKDLNN